MVKHTQTILPKFVDELFKCVWPFLGVYTERVNIWLVNNDGNDTEISFLQIVKSK